MKDRFDVRPPVFEDPKVREVAALHVKEIGERLSGEDIKRPELKARVEALLGIVPIAAAAPPAA